MFLGLKTYFILGRKTDVELTGTSVWAEDAATMAGVSFSINSSNNSTKKANSLPSILDEVGNDTDSNSTRQETPLRTARSVSQDRKRKLYNQQRSQQDEISPLSTGEIHHRDPVAGA